MGLGGVEAAPANPAPFAGRLGGTLAERRTIIERQQEAGRKWGGNWKPFLIRSALTASGLYRRGLRNATRIEVRVNVVTSMRLPPSFLGFTLLHLSDLHADMNPLAMRKVARLARELDYDLCVITGDFRGQTFGPFAEALNRLAPVARSLKAEAFAVLGNHDPAAMVCELERLGIQVLLNERIAIERGGGRIHLAGIDDVHYYGSGCIARAATGMPPGEYSILLSHTPEVYREAERSGFDLLLCGHTHGGQICLPGGLPLTLDARLPRHMGGGAWRHRRLAGYTSVGAGSSVVPVRFNCPPEVTLHHLALP
jgi:predicted MPP superfamily phosphohydrolase